MQFLQCIAIEGWFGGRWRTGGMLSTVAVSGCVFALCRRIVTHRHTRNARYHENTISESRGQLLRAKGTETEYRVSTTGTSENGPRNDKLLRSHFLPFPCPEFYLQLMINSFRIESMCNGKTKWSFMFISTSITIYIVYTSLDLSRVPRRPDQTGTRATESALTQMVSRLCMHECCAQRGRQRRQTQVHILVHSCVQALSVYIHCV